MSMNQPRRRPDGRERFERRPPDYRYPYYGQPYPYPYYPQPYPYAQPYPYTQPAPAAPQPGACPEGAMPYAVEEGDTLENLAGRLGVTPDQVVTVNPGVNFSIPLQSGQSICLPLGEES